MAVIDQLIQTGIRSESNVKVVRGSDGTIYTIYKGTTPNTLRCAYSTDAGLTWNEVDSDVSTQNGGTLDLAIDSMDVLHVVYQTVDDYIKYKQFSNFTWGDEEDVSITQGLTTQQGAAIAVDSSDIPHVVWIKTSDGDVQYSNRSGGTWSAELDIASADCNGVNLVIDSNNYIYVIYMEEGGTDEITYVKYTSFWTSPVVLANTSINSGINFGVTIDTSDNVHVVWERTTGVLAYTKYTASTDLWSAEAVVTTVVNDVENVSISSDSNNILTVLYNSDSGIPRELYIIQNTGSWGTSAVLKSASGSDDFQYPQTKSTIWPIVGGAHTNMSTAGYQFLYNSQIGASDTLRFYSSTNIAFPAPQDKNYSRKASASLPSTDSNLSTLFNPAGYGNVLTENDVFEDQAATDQYSIQMFKNKGNSPTDIISVSWIGKTSIAPALSTVYLQIYNRTSTTWETLSSNSSSGANVSFTLIGSKTSSLSDYYDGSNWVSCRVYQLAQ